MEKEQNFFKEAGVDAKLLILNFIHSQKNFLVRLILTPGSGVYMKEHYLEYEYMFHRYDSQQEWVNYSSGELVCVGKILNVDSLTASITCVVFKYRSGDTDAIHDDSGYVKHTTSRHPQGLTMILPVEEYLEDISLI